MSHDLFGSPMFEGVDNMFLTFFLSFYGITMLSALAGGVVLYILQSKGLYAIAKRRGIHHPALAWLPIGNFWIVGCISDQYQYVAKGNIRNRRKKLLRLSIGMNVLTVLFTGLVVFFIVSGIENQMQDAAMILSLIGWYGVYIALIVLSVIGTVFLHIACFDLYRSCNPTTSVMFLVLGIVLGLQPIFIFINRMNDMGMPPRRMPVVPAPAAEEPAVTEEPYILPAPENPDLVAEEDFVD